MKIVYVREVEEDSLPVLIFAIDERSEQYLSECVEVCKKELDKGTIQDWFFLTEDKKLVIQGIVFERQE